MSIAPGILLGTHKNHFWQLVQPIKQFDSIHTKEIHRLVK